MKCTLIVSSGKERSQRSCDMQTKPTTREDLVAFLKSQDLRLETGDFDFTVSFDGMDNTMELRTDADVRLFLAQARQMGDRATFHVRPRKNPAVPPDMESFQSAEYAVDMDLATLHIYPPATTEAASSSTSSRAYQEKTFVVPTRFVLDGLLRVVRDTLGGGTLPRSAKVALFSLSSADDWVGSALVDDAAALALLHGQAKRREPTRLTYTVEAVQSPTSRQHGVSTPQRANRRESTAGAAPSPPVEAAAPVDSGRDKPTSTLPPLTNSGECAAAPSPSKPRVPTLPTQLPASSAETPVTRRSSTHHRSSASSTHTSYRAFLREPTSPSSAATVPVEVRMEETPLSRAFTFSYLKTEIQLCSRFSAECKALFGGSGVPVLTLSSDISVVIDSDGVLRELLALSREAQQPLRVRLRFLSPATSGHLGAETEVKASSYRQAAPRMDVSSLKASPTPQNGSASLTPLASVQERNHTLATTQAPSSRPLSQAPLPPLSASAESLAHTVAEVEEKEKVTGSSATPVHHEEVAATSPPATLSSAETEDDGSPPPLMATAPQPPSLSSTSFEQAHVCFWSGDTEDDAAVVGMGGDASFCRFQAATRWGSVQRMTLCRVRRGHLFDDLCHGVAESFSDLLQDNASSQALTMELVYMADGTPRSLPLTAETTFDALPSDLYVESAELRVASPLMPPVPTSIKLASADDNGFDRADNALLQLIVSAATRQLKAVQWPIAAAEFHLMMTSSLGARAAREPYATFLSAQSRRLKSDPHLLSGAPDAGERRDAPQLLLKWLQRVLNDLSLPAPEVHAVLQEMASSLLCADVCDTECCLNRFFSDISTGVAAIEQEKGSSDALRSLWQRSPRAALLRGGIGDTERADLSESAPSTASEWRRAFDRAPSHVLDVIAAARMDGLTLPLPSSSPFDIGGSAGIEAEVWRETFLKAQLRQCEMMAPAELEAYIKGAEEAEASSAEQLCRAILLSCLGALLSPASPAEDYGDWLVHHFRGRVGAVLYAKMGSFDGRTALSLPSLICLSWTLIHPALPALVKTSAVPALVETLLKWARAATGHACYMRQLSFPPCPLYHVHPPSPSPLHRHELPPPPSTTEAAAGGDRQATGEENPGTAVVLPGAGDVTDAPTPPLASSRRSPSSPTSEAALPADRKTPKKRVQYVYRYNFNSLHRPRS